jgi:hypothetical protein
MSREQLAYEFAQREKWAKGFGIFVILVCWALIIHKDVITGREDPGKWQGNDAALNLLRTMWAMGFAIIYGSIIGCLLRSGLRGTFSLCTVVAWIGFILPIIALIAGALRGQSWI